MQARNMSSFSLSMIPVINTIDTMLYKILDIIVGHKLLTIKYDSSILHDYDKTAS